MVNIIPICAYFVREDWGKPERANTKPSMHFWRANAEPSMHFRSKMSNRPSVVRLFLKQRY